jgi:hypothetical protein
MKRRFLKLFGVLGAAALILVFVSCNPNPSAEDVTLDQIGRHSGTTYTDSTEAGNDLGSATTQTGSGLEAAEDDAETRGLFIDKQVELMANSAVSRVQSMVDPKTVTVEYELGSNGGFMASMTIDDHTINGAGSGTMDIPSYFVELSVNYNSDATRAEAQTWTEGSILFTDYNDGVHDVVIEDGRINVGGRSSVVAEVVNSDILISFDIYMAYKMGFALHNPSTGNGGRVIINMEYEYNLEPTSYSTFTTTAWSPDTFGNATATLEVYDNNDDPVFTETYTGSEIYDLATDINISGGYIE